MQPIATFRTAPPPRERWPIPALAAVQVTETAAGFEIRPRSAGASWWIEAIVWTIASALGAVALAQTRWGSLRVVGACVVAIVGIRALMRVGRLLFAGALRTLRVNVTTPIRSASGPMTSVVLSQVARFEVSTMSGGLWLCAFDPYGKPSALIEIDEGQAADYRVVCGWLGSMLPG